MRINFRLFIFILLVLLLLNFVNAYDLSEYPSPFIKDGKFDGVIVIGDNAPADDVIAVSDIVLSLQYPILGSDPESVMGLDTLMENQTKTYTIKGLDYEVTLNFIDKDSAQFIINGWTTARLLIGDGDTLVDGTRITLADIFFEDSRYSATFFFGKKEIKVTKTTVEKGGAKLASEVEDIKSVNSILIGHACDNPLILEVTTKTNCKEGYENGVGLIEAYEFPNGKISMIVTGYSTNDTFNAAHVLSFYGYYKKSFKGNNLKIFQDKNKLVIQSYKSPYKPKNFVSAKNDFNEVYIKTSILVFVLLILILFFIIRKKPRKKKVTKFKYSTKKR